MDDTVSLKQKYWSLLRMWRDPKRRPHVRVLARAGYRSCVGVPEVPEDLRFVFICGLHRSGTTLLTSLLRRHGDVTGFEGTPAPEDEGQFLQDVLPFEPYLGAPGTFAYRGDNHLTEASQLATIANGQRMLRGWSRYVNFDTPFFIEKSPPNLLRMRAFQRMFPGARFVVLVRHPIPVSLATFGFSRRGREAGWDKVLEHWFAAHQMALADVAHLNQVEVVRYEDLIASPAETLARVTALLNISALSGETPVQDHNSKYFERWRADPGNLTDQLAALNARYGDLMGRLGYRAEPPFVLPLPDRAEDMVEPRRVGAR